MFYQIPPVGNPIHLVKSKKLTKISTFEKYQAQFYASGTAALAAALVAVVGNAKETQSSKQVEVIFPAYGCPDLISAAVFAGVKPVLVDLEAERPWMDLSLLEKAITENTIAIVGVDLFGIPERWSQLRVLTERFQLVLIEDSAQYFPAVNQPSNWQGDVVILSFGRGKPVSLLGGGVVLTKNDVLYEHLPKRAVRAASQLQKLLYALKIRLYNMLISPFVYWLPLALPFLHLGETRYHALTDIAAMDQTRLNMLTSNIVCYQSDVEAINRCKKVSTMVDSLEAVNNLPQDCNIGENHRLLRYPLLIEEELREMVCQELKRSGLGVSIMYPEILSKIEGVSGFLDKTHAFPNAEAFVSRLITLPTHSALNEKNIKTIKAILKRATQ